MPDQFPTGYGQQWVLVLAVLLLLSLVFSGWALFLYMSQKKRIRELRKYEKENRLDEFRLLDSLINIMPDLIYVKDKNSKFLITNQRHAELFGLDSPVRMIGKSDFDLHPRDMANKYFWSEKELMANKKSVINLEEEVLDHKGNKFYFTTTKIPLVDSQGECYGLVGIGRDISDRKRAEQKLLEHTEELQQVNALLEEKQEEIAQQTEELKSQTETLSSLNRELERLSLVARETDNLVLILDAEGNIEWVNSSFSRIYGESFNEFSNKLGVSILKVSHHPDIPEIFNRCRETSESVSYETKSTSKAGTPLWFQSNMTPVLDNDGNISKYIIIDSDITDLKMAQGLISEQKKEIEDQRDELEKLNRTKDKFMSIIAHDLRNPFHSILGFSDILVQNGKELDEEKKMSYIRLINDSALFAHDLLENLLQWSRSQTEMIRFNPSHVDLKTIVRDVERISRASMEKKHLEFSCDISEGNKVYADENMLNAIIRNLLNNAIKFTPENGRIAVTMETMNGQHRISVSDTGTGIKKEDVDKILNIDEFHSTAGTSGEPGTGLGLILVTDFIARHGGKLEIDSKPGKGSTFSFSLPLNGSMPSGS